MAGLTIEEARNLKTGTMLTCLPDGRRAIFDKLSPGREPSRTHGATAWIYVNWPPDDYVPATETSRATGGQIQYGSFAYPCQDFEIRNEQAVAMVGVGAVRGLDRPISA